MRTIYITLLIILPQMISSRTIFVAEEGSLYRKGLLHIESVSYIRFENIMVRNSRNVGIYVKGPGTANIELVNCKTDDTYNSGIGIWYADSVLVKGCEITRANNQDMRPEGFPLRREAPHEALTLAGATNFTVTENHIHSCYKEGIDCKEVSSHGVIFNNYIHDLPRQGLYVDCWFGMLENVEIYSNIVHDCEWGAAISGEGKDAKMKNIRLHHNILYNNRASGILFGVWGHAFNGES
ncbi:MAG: right-handed parallel beta-helix repeat-containing protein, partial [bacterium]